MNNLCKKKNITCEYANQDGKCSLSKCQKYWGDINKYNKERLFELLPNIPESSGIYIFTRHENGLRYAYIGQAVNLLQRIVSHLSGYQHIDLSIKKRGLFDRVKNITGWRLWIYESTKENLDINEEYWIRQYANKGYQLYNHTTGGQGEGKQSLGEAKSPKTYREGIAQGEKNVIKQIKHLFDLHLKAIPKADKPSKNAEKALNKFYEMIGE